MRLTAFPERAYFGDVHVHSAYSLDAYAFGNMTLMPDDAYLFASGNPIELPGAGVAKLDRPLDFLMVADHAEYLGVLVGLKEGDQQIVASDLGDEWSSDVERDDTSNVVLDFVRFLTNDDERIEPPEEFEQSVWKRLVEAAERHNRPGEFTTFSGYEWTSQVNGGNQHRVVLFRDGPEKVLQMQPFSAVDSTDPRDLWAHLARYEEKTDGRVLAIPHNGNLANGDMFSLVQPDGKAMDRSYSSRRARWEPLYEVTQIKGDGEAHPVLSAEDEFADFETWDATNIALEPKPQDPDSLKPIVAGEYAREALKRGLSIEQQTGANPYAFGLVGSTDSHNTMSTADDDNFWGKFPDSAPRRNRLSSKMGGALWGNERLSASGYMAVWARANTREEIFAAMERREVYATTGPRMRVRFFGGWSFSRRDLEAKDWLARAYKGGSPMGSYLREKNAVLPSFMISATKDPEGANLDRVQVIKGWLDADGQLHEKVFDVVWSGTRLHDQATGKLEPVGNTVDPSKATYLNTIGSAELRTIWVDPDFDESEPAFYYLRVLEIPTPRWTLYDAVRYDIRHPESVPQTTQQRAYTSPIWYRPG